MPELNLRKAKRPRCNSQALQTEPGTGRTGCAEGIRLDVKRQTGDCRDVC
jgi:hypothetical protein